MCVLYQQTNCRLKGHNASCEMFNNLFEYVTEIFMFNKVWLE